MQKHIVGILVLLCLSFSALADDRRNELLGVIDLELGEVTRLTRINKNDPELRLRRAELLLERARIIREGENTRFLQIPPKKRKKINKKKFFSESRKYFSAAQKTAFFILNKFKKFHSKGDVYYILAFNAKEFGNEKDSRKYLKAAIKYSKPGSPARIKSQIALADIHYNDQNYAKAAPLYRDSLRKKNDKWWTKDAYNLAWCYFRLDKKQNAINLMREVHKFSKKTQFIDVSPRAERDLAYFYTEAGQVNTAVKFYKRSGGAVVARLMSVGKNLVDQGKLTSAEKVYQEAVGLPHSEAEDIELQLVIADLYDKFGREGKHLVVIQKLATYKRAGKLNEDHDEKFNYHVKKWSALLQKQVAGKQYKHNKKLLRLKADRSVAYFKLLVEFKPKKSHTYNFLAGETFFAAEKYDEAISLYDTAYRQSLERKDKKIRNRALTSMIAALGEPGVSEATKTKYLHVVYLAYLTHNPRTKKAFTLFQRLFSIYFEKGDIKNCEDTLIAFKKNFPKSKSKQEAMLARIMDHYKKQNDHEGIRKWVARINAGEFKVSRKYAKTLKALLLNMQFANVENAKKEGDQKKALKFYVDIYRDKSSSKEAKKNASYNIALLFSKLADGPRTFAWTERAMSHMPDLDIVEYKESFLTIGSFLFERRMFKESGKIYTSTLSRLCKRKDKIKQTLFKNAVVTYLADGEVQSALNVITKYGRCNMPNKVVRNAQLDVLDSLRLAGRWKDYSLVLGALKGEKGLWPELIHLNEELANYYRESGKKKSAYAIRKQIFKFYNYLNKNNISMPLESLDVIAKYQVSDLNRWRNNFQRIKLSFPERTYNSRLQTKIKALDKLTTKALEVLNVGSGRGIVDVYRILVEDYTTLVDDILKFTPPGKSAEYIASFKKGMTQLVSPFQQQINKFKVEARGHINKGSILSSENYWFLSDTKTPVRLEYSYPRGGIVMDRGGRR